MHLFHDTPDYYTTSLMGRVWDTVHADAIVDANDGYGGGGALSASSANGSVIKYHDQAGQSAFACGMRFKCTTLPGADKVILAVVDAAGTIQCCVVLKTTGKLALYKGNLTTQIGSDSAAAITTSTQLDIGFKGVVGSVNGSGEVWVGDAGDPTTWTRVIAVSNANTAGGSGEFHRGVFVGSTTATFTSHVYMRDGQGSQVDLVPGYFIFVKLPDAPGGYTGFSANAGALDDALDDAAADDDTTHAVTYAIGSSYSVSMSAVTSRAVLAVETVQMVKNVSPDGVGLTHVPRCVIAAGALYDGPWQSASDSVWKALRQRWPVNPSTGLAWTDAEINASEWGGYANP